MDLTVLISSRGSTTTRIPARPETPWILLLPALLTTLLFFGGGLLLGLFQSVGWLPGEGLEGLSLAPLKHVFTDPGFGKSLLLTFHIAGLSTFLAALFGLMLALFLSKQAGTSGFFRFLVQLPLTVPHLVVAIATLYMLAPSGMVARLLQGTGLMARTTPFPLLVNDTFGIGILFSYVWKEIPFITVMVLSVLEGGGKEFLDAAKSLGAGPFQQFRFVILPVCAPALTASSLIVFAYSFGAYEIPFLLGRTWPVPLPVWAWRRYSDVDLLERPEGIATGLIIFLVITLSVVLAGLLMGRIKRR